MAKLGVDIGGTFTDVVLEAREERWTTKVLTTHVAPEEGVLAGIIAVLQKARMTADQVKVLIHGTTLATNALIERRGAKTAFVTTEGFRDTLEMGYESRYEQYDINIDLPKPLVPRKLRFTVDERVDARGTVLLPLNEDQLRRAADRIASEPVGSIAVGFINSYLNPEHEYRAREILREHNPAVPISLSAEVSPEMREYERFSTTCANAYVKPLMAGYLWRLETTLADAGFRCPLYLMLSGGGITTLETAAEFPVRLIESGPAGGAIFAAAIAAECGAGEVLSFDMGGTTAKICFIDNATPQTSRRFEVARMYRFKKGSGLPLRIPVVEMVEIGAGGGSVAHIDSLSQIAVGPESAGSEPGPACYGRGGLMPTVTDADLVMGRISPAGFAGGRMPLHRAQAERAIDETIGRPQELSTDLAAFGIGEMVDENMANAARMHGIESGKNIETRTLIAFGGAAPLHALQVAERLGIERVIVPTGAGVGSAIGFLRAPVAYEITRSFHQPLDHLDVGRLNRLFDEMHRNALAVVGPGALGGAVREQRLAYMRYVGQGHEIAVPLPVGRYDESITEQLRHAFDERYRAVYGRTIPTLAVEALGWSLTLTTEVDPPAARPDPESKPAAEPAGYREIFEPGQRRFITVPVYQRAQLEPGTRITGPAVIEEDETSTVISSRFDAVINGFAYIECQLRAGGETLQ
jgi:N-methylhydantoinase A